MTARERAWIDIHDVLPDGWRVGPVTYDPGRPVWIVTARSPRHGGRHGPPPAAVSGMGEDETAALTDRALRLRELRAIEARMALVAEARAAYHQGAEERSWRSLGRPLTPLELARVIERWG